MGAKLQKLKEDLGALLSVPANLKMPLGLATGVLELDSFLNWRGFPVGELTLLRSHLGLGATQLWLGAAQRLAHEKKWSIWINEPNASSRAELFPTPLFNNGFDLAYLMSATPKKENLFFTLKEILSADIFTLIACTLNPGQLKPHHLQKLLKLTRTAKVSLVFLQTPEAGRQIPTDIFSLVLKFTNEQITIERAKHHQTPHFISRRWSYACFMPEFAKAQFIDPRRSFSQVQSAGALSHTKTDLY